MRTMSKSATYLLFVAVLLFISGCTAKNDENDSPSSSGTNQEQPISQTTPPGDHARVVLVIDGDTIDVDLQGREFRVRYIGVDTPERDDPFYEEASSANRSFVEGQDVILVRDVSETDPYGRLLRYVYLPDGTFVNAELISQGYGQVVTFPPDVDQTENFLALQVEARENQRGLWGLSDMQAMPESCTTCSKNNYDCKDFATQDDAQACFDICMQQTGEDIHHLDGGGDGIVCESLP